MTVDPDTSILLPVRRRRFIHGITLPLLARCRLYDPARKPKGAARLKRKLAQSIDDLVHGGMKIPARGTMKIGDESHQVDFDAHQSAFLAFVSREQSGGYEPVETLFLEFVLARSSVFYDVGCNWGYFSLLAGTHPEFNGQVFAFDVSEEMNSSLARMAGELGLPDVTVTGYGLSDQAGAIGVSGGRSAHLTQVARVTTESAGRARRTATVACLDQLSLPPPDLMKIDVEDHEQAVFEGGREMLVKHHPLILFECRGDRVGSAAGEVLCAFGYRLYAMRWQSEKDSVIELTPVSADELSTLGQTNVVAVTEANRGRWFG